MQSPGHFVVMLHGKCYIAEALLVLVLIVIEAGSLDATGLNFRGPVKVVC